MGRQAVSIARLKTVRHQGQAVALAPKEGIDADEGQEPVRLLGVVGRHRRKDREHVEHRIRQLEISLGQVQSELNRLAYHVGHRNGREQRQENGHE